MEPTFQTTSFIPKKPLASVKPQASKSSSIFTVLSVIILIATILSSVFLHVWSKKVTGEIDILKKTLSDAQDRFDPVTLENLKKIDRQINTAEKILSNHLTLSPILTNVLNANTLKKVQYIKFSHTVTGTGPAAKISVRLAGKAESLPYVAQQSKKLAENRYVQNPLFSDINTTKEGPVTFNLIFDISPNLIVYNQLVSDLSGSSDTPPVTSSGLPTN